MFIVQLLVRFCYNSYCNKHFEETKYRHAWDKSLFVKMTGFAGWNLFEVTSCALYTQGLNILLNIFFGPVVNAARAISVQVLSTVRQFIGNFQTAINPQITKTYAQGDMDSMHKLVYRSAKFSFFILLFITLPVFLECDFILRLWLGIVPPDAVTFLRIMICVSLIYTMANPLVVANQATGNVRNYQIICGTLLLMILPISYVCLRLGLPAYSVFVVHFVIEAITQIARMIISRSTIKLNIKQYVSSVYVRALSVFVCSIIIPCILHTKMTDGFIRLITVCSVSFLSVMASSYAIGFSNKERKFIKDKVVVHFKALMYKV